MTDSSGEIESGDMVKVVEPFYDEHNDKEISEVVGDVGRVDVVRDDGRYLVLFPGARGWFIPENKIEPADPDDWEPWWSRSI